MDDLFTNGKSQWSDRSEAFKDFQYLTNLRYQLITQLSEKLNNIHKVSLTEKSWHLMIGYWLVQFLTVTFDRYNRVKKKHYCNKKMDLCLNEENWENIVPNSTSDATNLFVDDKWNRFFFCILTGKEIPDQFDFKKNIIDERLAAKNNTIIKFKNALKKFYFGLFNYTFFHNQNYVLSSTYLRDAYELIHLRCLIGPFYYEPVFPEMEMVKLDFKFREWLLPSEKDENNFEKLVKKLIPIFIPKSFLENFSSLQKKIISSQLPKNVNVIFTSNKHFSDDVFKIWAAQEIDAKAKLVIGQHGGGPFHKYNGGHQYELDVADFAITTGNGNNAYPNLRDVGQFFHILKKGNWDPNGKALLVTGLMPRYVFDLRSMALAGEVLDYFKDQFLFYNSLPLEIQKKMIIRLYPEDYGWNQKQRWLERFPQISLDEGNASYYRMIKKCRLFISTYMATTYNESLAANIPSVIYWNPDHWTWADSAETDFIALKSVGIFHDTPESAAQHVTKVWEDVAAWWYSSEVQVVRELFCRKYAHRGKDVIPKLAAVLKEAGLSTHS